MIHDSCKYYLIHLRFLYQDIIFISYKNYLLNLTYIFLLFYISVAVFEYYVCMCIREYKNRLIKIEPRQIESSFRKKANRNDVNLRLGCIDRDA